MGQITYLLRGERFDWNVRGWAEAKVSVVERGMVSLLEWKLGGSFFVFLAFCIKERPCCYYCMTR
jgi:hypothetical protein